MTASVWCSWCLMVAVLSQCVCGDHFTDKYAVQVDGGADEARRIAAEHGFVYINEVHFAVN